MNSETDALVEELKLAVTASMDPNTPRETRMQAYQACENFKETSEHCAACGVVLADQSQPAIIRHFGLQLLEQCIRIRWNNLKGEEKVFIKDKAMQLLATGTLDILREEAHVKDALSRVIVEMIKREWPQQWPSLFQELDALCDMGPTQTELVLLILLRLAEDILIFQTVPNQRRREIMQGLTASLSQLQEYFVQTLDKHYGAYREMQNDPDQALEASIHLKVTVSVVNTISGFVEWMSWTFLDMQNGHLLRILCSMLADRGLQLCAAECLLLICSRKGKIDERKPLMLLFSEEAMSAILRAATEAASDSLDEYHYAFLKRLCQVLVTLGNQLCNLWGSVPGVEQPQSFAIYLNAILAFTRHSSQVLSNYTQSLWTALLRHSVVSQSTILHEAIPLLLETTRTSLLKVGFPSQSTVDSCKYARLDFDSDEDFNAFFIKHRQEISEVIRQATLLSPQFTFRFAADWLQSLLAKPIPGTGDQTCTLNSPAYLDWDSLALFIDCVMARLNQSDKPKPDPEEGVALLKAVLAFETQDPLILSSVLSCSSYLFPFINNAPDLLGTILDKMFSIAVFNRTGQTKSNRSRAVRNVRLHACSGLVKIAKDYPLLLLPGFDQLYSHIKNLNSELSRLEQCTLLEVLILISNQFKNFEKQSAFLEEILLPFKERWLSNELKHSLWNAEKFMSYVGLDQPAVEPSSEDICGINRSQVLQCVNVIFAVLKRSSWPAEIEDAESGGFMAASSNGNRVYRNPVFQHLIPMFDNVLAFIRTLNALLLHENVSRRHQDFMTAFDIMDTDKKQIMGQIVPSVEIESTICRQPLERMQSFLNTVYFNCHHILGNAGPMLGHDFYEAPALASSLINSLLTHLDLQPDYRLKPLVRAFIKPFSQHCPPEFHGTALLPVLQAVCPYMYQRLMTKWQASNEDAARRLKNNEDQEEQEVLEDQIIRQLTREYLDFIGCLFREKRSLNHEPSQDMEDEPVEQNGKTVEKDDSISALGQLILSTEGLNSTIVLTVFNGLSWNDTVSSFKCIGLSWPIMKQLLAMKQVTSEDACFALTAILHGLEQHGEHEGHQSALISLGLTLYENLRPQFPDIVSIFLLVPNCSADGVKAFDDKLLGSSPHKMLPEKKRKEGFRKLVQDVIGKNIGQRFKQEIHIKNLPPLFRQPKPRPQVLDGDGEIGLCALFAHDD